MATEKQRECTRRWREQNREYDLARKRAHRIANRERYVENCNRWFEANPGYKEAYNKEYYLKNKEAISEQKKGYYHRNQKASLKRNAQWQTRQRRSNPVFRLRQAISLRIYKSLKGHCRYRTMALTGCKLEFLKGWLESRFQPGMSWENYGRHGWHVDHVIPCKAFDLSNPVEIKQCFHYSNLQPLWAKDNLRKGTQIYAGDGAKPKNQNIRGLGNHAATQETTPKTPHQTNNNEI
jgi:hypothetical protein